MAIIQTPKRYAFVLDTTITNHIPRMTFSQSDVGSNILTISLTQNLVPYPLTATGLIINLFVVNGSSKSWQSSTDGSIVVTSTTGGTVEVTMSSGTISNIGTNSCEINVQDILGNDYTFPPFKFEVIANYANDVVSTNDLLPLIQATSNANTAYNNSINYTKMETYDPSHPYLPLNKVKYQGGVYQNIIASTGISPTYNIDNVNWLCISPKSSDGYASIVPSSFTATANNTTHIITGYATYDKTHDTMQVIDATYGDVLIKNIDYTENADNLSIDLINNNILNTGEVMIFNLYKNINDSTIQSDIASAITAKSNLDASISTGNATKSAIDASITSGQLGNASTLTTTSKIIVGAINENKANIDLKANQTALNTTNTNITSLDNILRLDTVALIQAKSFNIGDKIFSKLYGGSVWIVQASVTMGLYSPITISDDLHLVVNLIGGGTGIAECQWDSIVEYAKSLNSSNFSNTVAKLISKQSVIISCLGDSVTYGQNNDEAGSIDRTGQATGFGDGSVYDSNKQDANPYPNILESTLRTNYGYTNITVKNLGFSGDYVGKTYIRHSINVGSSLEFIFLGINDMLNNTTNGTVPGNITNDSDLNSINNFVFHYRKLIIREMLRGNSIVLLSGYLWNDAVASPPMTMYNNAIKELGIELNIPVYEIANFLTSKYLFGVHPSHVGYNNIGKNIANLLTVNNNKWSNLTLLNNIYSLQGGTAQYCIENSCIKFRGIIQNDAFTSNLKICDLPYNSLISGLYSNKIFNDILGGILKIVDNGGNKELWWMAQSIINVINLAQLVIYIYQ